MTGRLLVLLTFYVVTVTAQQATLTGVVSDKSGAVIKGASIQFESAGRVVVTTSNADGEFTIPSATPSGRLTVSYPGFTSVVKEISDAQTLRITLEPSALIERIDVRSTDERISSLPASQFSIPKREVTNSGATTLDDVLRQLPGFSLFRRSGSLTANPTSQGVTLRGVGANGASRALVLVDGIPLNSPFGAWVYWNRIPRVAIDSVDAYNGATSDLYGSGALGGVINLRTAMPEQDAVKGEVSLGNERTPVLSLEAGKSFDRWMMLFGFQGLRTDGFVQVPDNQRGTVDVPANTADLTGTATVFRRLSNNGRAFVRLNSFGESRENGTPLQINNTRIWSLDSGLDWSVGERMDLSSRIYGSGEVFNQNFSAIAADRNSESLTNRQRNPSQQFGAAFQCQWALKQSHMLTAGFEARDVRGHSAEDTFAASRVTAHLDAGGRQDDYGVFVQDTISFGSFFLTIGARADHWTNSDGFSNRFPTTGSATLNNFPTRSENAFSPRLSIWHRFGNGLSVGGSFYQAFRAPTLNELYRSFRVGNVVTAANADLKAEKLTGGEVGASLQKFSNRLTLRSTLFWSDINDPVANVTLSITPAVINRQRQNLGAIRAQGIELNGSLKLNGKWEVSSEYLLTSSKVLKFSASPALVGLTVPQVPRNQLNLQVSYADGRWLAGVQSRMVGKQFDDDLNALTLRSFVTVDAHISRRISSRVQIFVAAQNLTGVRYEISKTPVTTIGPPVLVRVGARFALAR